MNKYPKRLHHEHSIEEIQKRLNNKISHSYVRDAVYGGIDGTITTFAVVSGVIGANLEMKTILILGMANLLADGFSMAASNYVGTKTEQEEILLLEEFEKEQIVENPDGEREEVRQILINKGFNGKNLEDSTDLFISDLDQWVDLMLKEEYGVASGSRSPVKAGASTFLAFMLFGLVPLSPFILKVDSSFTYSCLFTGGTFFMIGSLKSFWTGDSFWISGFKTFGIGACAASLAFVIGYLLKGFH